MKITFRELSKKSSDSWAKNVAKVAKIHETDSQKIVREGDRKHMYIVGARKFSKVTKCVDLKIHDKIPLNFKYTKFR